jgi:hypothetical protein
MLFRDCSDIAVLKKEKPGIYANPGCLEISPDSQKFLP